MGPGWSACSGSTRGHRRVTGVRAHACPRSVLGWIPSLCDGSARFAWGGRSTPRFAGPCPRPPFGCAPKGGKNALAQTPRGAGYFGSAQHRPGRLPPESIGHQACPESRPHHPCRAPSHPFTTQPFGRPNPPSSRTPGSCQGPSLPGRTFFTRKRRGMNNCRGPAPGKPRRPIESGLHMPS